jgi:hypothetical protein
MKGQLTAFTRFWPGLLSFPAWVCLMVACLASAEQLVIDNEIYGMVIHREQGIDVSGNQLVAK